MIFTGKGQAAKRPILADDQVVDCESKYRLEPDTCVYNLPHQPDSGEIVNPALTQAVETGRLSASFEDL